MIGACLCEIHQQAVYRGWAFRLGFPVDGRHRLCADHLDEVSLQPRLRAMHAKRLVLKASSAAHELKIYDLSRPGSAPGCSSSWSQRA